MHRERGSRVATCDLGYPMAQGRRRPGVTSRVNAVLHLTMGLKWPDERGCGGSINSGAGSFPPSASSRRSSTPSR